MKGQPSHDSQESLDVLKQALHDSLVKVGQLQLV